MKEWITDHRPTEPGRYWVTLECDGATKDAKTGKNISSRTIHRWVDQRNFIDPDGYEPWMMDGENPYKPHWTQGSFSYLHERVVAWMPIENVAVYQGDLKEGKKYIFNEFGFARSDRTK